MLNFICCSVIIPTIGRATLHRAILSVIIQELKQAEYEVIVVNDVGQPLSKTGWEQSERVHIIETNRHEQSIARNSRSAVARGDYLTLLDDDDWLLPGALDSFWQLASQKPQAVWLYGGIFGKRSELIMSRIHTSFRDESL